MARHAIAIALAIATTATATTTANAQAPTDVAGGQLAAPTDVIRSEAVSRRGANGYATVVVDDQWTERYVHSKHTFVSLPITLGFTTAGDNGFAYGVRPQLVRASLVEGTRRDKQRQGFGIGGYAELSRANGSALVGGGVMLARYYAPLALSPALGVYHRSDEMASATGLAVSMSTGFRNFIDLDHFDFPHELRIEGHIGLGATKERSVTITLELDTALMVSAITAALVGLGSIGS